jgi:hypothetical protein
MTELLPEEQSIEHERPGNADESAQQGEDGDGDAEDGGAGQPA